MGKSRLEAFSDGVIAIIITIMVLELHIPEKPDWEALINILPKLAIYLLSFVFVGIYWMNHHHLLHATKKINGKILWANLCLLFCLSLFPFVANWMGENLFEKIPTFTYGIVLFVSGLSYLLLQNMIIKSEGEKSLVALAIGNDWKGKLTAMIIVIGIIFSFILTQISLVSFVVITMIWLIPDKRIEKLLINE